MYLLNKVSNTVLEKNSHQGQVQGMSIFFFITIIQNLDSYFLKVSNKNKLMIKLYSWQLV